MIFAILRFFNRVVASMDCVRFVDVDTGDDIRRLLNLILLSGDGG